MPCPGAYAIPASLIVTLTCLLPGLCSALAISGLLSSISDIVFSELTKGSQPVSGMAGSSLTSRVILWLLPATLPGIYAQGMNSKPGDLPGCTTSLPQSWPPKGVEGSPLPSTTFSHSLSPSHSFASVPLESSICSPPWICRVKTQFQPWILGSRFQRDSAPQPCCPRHLPPLWLPKMRTEHEQLPERAH